MPRRSDDGCAYTVKQVAGDGNLGVVTTRRIRLGEMLLVEKPLVRLTPDIGQPGEHYFDDPVRVKKLLATLSGSAGPPLEWEWWDASLDAVCNTNSFTLSSPRGGPSHSYVFLHLSRFNHSCDPNALMIFDGDTEIACVRTTRDIPAGAEVCINYGAEGDLATRRKHLLRCFGFTCECSVCVKEARA